MVGRSGLAALALALAPWATAGSAAQAGDTPPPTPPALRLDGVEIPADEYARWLVRNFGERSAKVFAAEYQAVEIEARRAGVEATPEECAARVDRDIQERIQKAFFGKKAEWLGELERTRRTEAGVRLQRETEVRPFVLAERMAAIDRVVPEQKIVRDWEMQYGRNGKRYDLRMTKVLVVVPSEEGQTREEWQAGRERVLAAGREKALAVRARIAAGEDFGAVARETSDDPDTKDGRGVPRGGFRHFGWPRSFLDALEELAPGELSEPLFARGGWWIVRVDAVHETPLASVREKLHDHLARKGPEDDEVATILERIRYATKYRLLPALFDEGADPELSGPGAPVLEVDGELVSRATFTRWMLAIHAESYLQRFLEDWAIERKAREAGVTVTDAEIEERQRLELEYQIRESYKGTRESWLEFLARGGRTQESFLHAQRERTRTDLLAEKLLLRERTFTPDDVRRKFHAEYGQDGERIEARWIVLIHDPGAIDPAWSREELTKALGEAVKRGQARAAEVVARVRAGEDFGKLARELSDDAPTRANGGRLEGRFRGDVYPPGFGAAVAKLAVGEITDPLDYGNAWAIFQVTARRKVAFEEVEKELLAELKSTRPSGTQVNAHRNGLTQELEVEILPGMAAR